MKSNADDSPEFDFHPWPRPRSGSTPMARTVIGSVVLAIIVIDTILSEFNLGRLVVTCIVAYVVFTWMRRRHPQHPER